MAEETAPCTTIDLVRHGEADGGRVFRGRTDSPLSARGRQQLDELFAVLPQAKLQALVSSPLQRCAQPARQWAEHLGLPLRCERGFQEIDFGRWEGRCVDEVYQQEAAAVKQFWTRPDQHTPHGGEALPDFQQRVLQHWHQLVRDSHDQHLVLLSHGGVMRIILGELLAMPLAKLTHIAVPHGCWSRICIYHSPNEAPWPQLVFHNKQAND